MEKLYSEACERNKYPIIEKLKVIFKDSKSVLEIGSGTGQHAVFFAENLNNLIWQTSDLIYSHNSINAYINESNLENIKDPILLDVSSFDFSSLDFNCAFTANTFHIMSFENVEKCFKGLSKTLSSEGLFCIYGPFKYKGKYTSESNYNFDLFLQKTYPDGAIRDIENVERVAKENCFNLINDFEMPSNNRLIVFKLNKS